MRTSLLPFLTMLFLAPAVSAQINAGDIPVNASVSIPGVILILSAPFTQTAQAFDVNCDGTADLTAVLIKGEPAVDAPNVAMLEVLDPLLELCKDQATYERPQYHSFGQPLDCAGSFSWQNDPGNTLGDFGGFNAIGPVVMDTMYMAYRLGTDVGWIKFSFILNNTLSVSFQIHEVMGYCGATGIEEPTAIPLTISPNPADGTLIRVESPVPVQHLEVLDSTGKLLARYGAGMRMIPAPELAGTYLLRATFADGSRSVARLMCE